MKIYMKYCLASYLHKWRVRDKLFNAITLQHFRTYVCVCVSVCVCGVGWELGWRRVWPHGCGSRCARSLSVKDCSTEPKEEESSAAWLRERRNRCGELKRDLQLLHPIVLNAASTVEWLSFSVYASSHNQISWHSAFLNLIFQIAFSSF